MFYRKYKNVIKRLVVISISLGGMLGVVLVGFFVAQLLSSNEQGVVVDYTDTSSVRSAEQRGIFLLEQQDIVLLQISPTQYRVARLLKNNNSVWSVRRLEYAFVVQNQEFVQTTAIPANAEHLVVLDVESLDVLEKSDVQFRINKSSWHTEATQQPNALRAHGGVVQTQKQGNSFHTTVVGTLTNDSHNPAHNVSVGVLVYSKGSIVGVGSVLLGVVEANTSQEFSAFVGSTLYSDIDEVQFITTSNAL